MHSLPDGLALKRIETGPSCGEVNDSKSMLKTIKICTDFIRNIFTYHNMGNKDGYEFSRELYSNSVLRSNGYLQEIISLTRSISGYFSALYEVFMCVEPIH